MLVSHLSSSITCRSVYYINSFRAHLCSCVWMLWILEHFAQLETSTPSFGKPKPLISIENPPKCMFSKLLFPGSWRAINYMYMTKVATLKMKIDESWKCPVFIHIVHIIVPFHNCFRFLFMSLSKKHKSLSHWRRRKLSLHLLMDNLLRFLMKQSRMMLKRRRNLKSQVLN